MSGESPGCLSLEIRQYSRSFDISRSFIRPFCLFVTMKLSLAVGAALMGSALAVDIDPIVIKVNQLSSAEMLILTNNI